MPKLKQPPAEMRAVRFKAAVSHNMVLCGISNVGELAPKVGLSTSGLYRRLKDPGMFSVNELYKLYSVLRFTDEQKLLLVKN